jgi:hypothetical protein
MDHYAGIDVSLECLSVCVVDASGKIIRAGKVASQPEALIGWFASFSSCRAGSGWRLGRCRNGFTRPCWRRVLRSNCWRHGTYGVP